MKSWIATASRINDMATAGIPFLFAFDFPGKESLALPLAEIDPNEILFDIAGFSNAKDASLSPPSHMTFEREAPDAGMYWNAFEKVMFHLKRGDSYLLNLTFPVSIKTNLSTLDIFQLTKAPFKLWVRNSFVVFSPESFVTIRHNRIHTFPMKGTISAQLPDAEQVLLNNQKELAEHYTIVDLLRNDIGMVSEEVRVERFRYIDTIHTLNGQLLQTSSHINGVLPQNWQQELGNILLKLLPAGSISGAPKRRTLEIISEAETDDRGFYTGVMGIFDGEALHSAVMIRFIEQRGEALFFRAGGGITVNSRYEEEYNELLQKVVLPFKPSY